MEAPKPSILIFQEKEIPSDGLALVTLPHPKHMDEGVLFCQAGRNIYELQSVQPRKYGAWFIDQRVSSKSSFLMASKFDPKFLLLPFLEKATRYSPLDQIITFVEGCDRIPLQHCADWNLGDICDVNDQLGDDMILYRLNMDKTLAWLRAKVDKTAAYMHKKQLKRKTMQVSTFNSGAQSKQGTGYFTLAFLPCIFSPMRCPISCTEPGPSVEEEPSVGRESTVQALAVICDILSDPLADKLLKTYDVDKESVVKSSKAAGAKRKADWETALEVCC